MVAVTVKGAAVASASSEGGWFAAAPTPTRLIESTYHPALAVALLVPSRQRARRVFPAYFAVSVRETTTCVKAVPLLPDHAGWPAKAFLLAGDPLGLLRVTL